MRRAFISAMAAALLIVPALSQDFGFAAAPGGPGGPALTSMLSSGITHRGVTGAGANSALLGGFGAPPFGGVDVASGDFNGDGVGDIVVAQGGTGGGTLTIFSAEGDGTFGVPVSVGLMNQPTSLATGDINMDGMADVIVGGVDFPSDPSGQLQIFSGANLSNGIPSATPPQWLDGVPTSVSIGRLNDDAFGDVAVALDFGGGTGGVETLFTQAGSGPATFQSNLFGTNGVPTGIDIGVSNIGADGAAPDAIPDIAVATAEGVSVFRTTGGIDHDFKFGFAYGPSDPAGVTAGNQPSGTMFGDVNGDNVTDILALNQGSGTLTTLLGNSGGGYGTPRTSPVGANPVDMSILNFNNDGTPDIAVLNALWAGSPGGVSMLQGNGSGGFTPAQTLPRSSWANVLAFGSASIFPRGQEPPNFNLGPGGSLNIINFCGLRPASCGGDGLSLPGRQTGVTAGTMPPSNSLMIRGEDHHASRGPDAIKGLGRLLAGLLTKGTPQPLASARYSVFATQQMRAQVEPAQVVITATGQSSGDFFRMEIIDQSGNVHRGVLPEGIVLEPVAVPPVAPSAGATVVSQDVSGFCLDFAKDVPAPGTRYRIANAAAQAQASSMRNVLAASKQLALRNLLHTDGTTGYVNFVRQYAVWAKREGWDIKKFGESFVQKTKQNVLSMKANWTDVMEQGVRAAIPGRWRDIEEVVRLSSQIATPPR